MFNRFFAGFASAGLIATSFVTTGSAVAQAEAQPGSPLGSETLER